MKLSKTSVAIIAVAGLLALSPSGRAQTNTPPGAGPGGRQGAGRGQSVEAQLTRYTEQLKLTDAQKPKVKELLEDQNKKRQELRNAAPEERRTKMQALQEDFTKKMKEILTADQLKKFEELQQQQRGRGNRRQGGATPGGAPGAPARGGGQQ